MNDCIIVGDGLFANIFAYYYLRKNPNKKLLQIHPNEFAPPTSEVSTAVVATRNTRKGISPLGDLMVDAHDEFLNFYSGFNGEGIEKCKHFQMCSLNSDKRLNFQKRFPEFKEKNNYLQWEEEGYLFYPNDFLNDIRKENLKKGISRGKGLVTSIEACKVIAGNKSFSAKSIVLGIGNYHASFPILNGIKMKKVRGSYLKIPYDKEKSFSKTINGINLVYRSKDKVLLVGNSQFEGEVRVSDYLNLLTMLKEHGLPSDDIKYISGVRDKCPKRMPYWGEISNGIFSAHGFYKNGYTFSFLAARELCELLPN